jgi:hypothetical protein
MQWCRYYLNEVSYNKPANEFYKQKLRQKLQQRLWWWTYWMRRRKGLRRGWIEKGYVMVGEGDQRFLPYLSSLFARGV